MTITETVYTTLAKYHELTTNGVYKHCAGTPANNYQDGHPFCAAYPGT